MTYKTKDLESALLSKGFQEALGRRRHRFFHFHHEGKKTDLFTHTSHGEKDFDEFLLNKRKKQMRLSKKQMIDFIECKFTDEMYLKHLLDNHLI